MKNILVVEDSTPILSSIVKEFENYKDMNPITATSYRETISILRSKKYEISFAMLDLTLDDADGNKIVALALSHNIPSLVLTASLNTYLRDIVFGRDIFDYILKNGEKSIAYAVKKAHDYVKHYDTSILIVDDVQTDRVQIKGILQEIDVKILEASNGVEALKIINDEDNNISIVIVDYLMPKMDGLELCMNIRADYNKDELAIIAISTSEDIEIIEKFIKVGSNDFIVKPCKIHELLVKVHAVLDLLELFKRTKDLANKDFLTGTYNRRYFFEVAELLFNKAKRKEESLVVAMIDIDKFKDINDTHGHKVGDLAIIEATRIIKDSIRESDLFARFGGEEFCILLDNILLEESKKLFEDIRDRFENNLININEKSISYTVSIGVFYGIESTIDAMIEKSDRALYEAKNSGRNKVVILS